MPIQTYEYKNYRNWERLLQIHKGNITWDFSQASSAMLDIAMHGRPENRALRGGICLALSAYWVYYHANDDSLVNHLGFYTQSNKYVPLKIEELNKIREKQQQWRGRVEPMLEWLNSKGVSLVSRSYNKRVNTTYISKVLYINPPSRLEAKNKPRIYDGTKSAKFRTDIRRISGAYALIGLDEGNSGHQVAAWIGGQDACFYDPNFGECWFERRDDFFNFINDFIACFYCYTDHYDIFTVARRVI